MPADAASGFWGVCGNQSGDNVYRCDGAQWEAVPGVHLTAVAATAGGRVWGVDGTNTSANNIYTYVESQWVQPLPGILTDICVTPDGVIWGVNGSQPRSSGSNVYKFSGGLWIGVPGYLTSVRATDGGHLWGLDSSIASGSNLFQYVGPVPDGPWQVYSTGTPVALTTLALGADHSLWGTDAANQIWGLVEDQGWQQVQGTAIAVAAGDFSSVVIVEPNGAACIGSFADQGELEVLIDDVLVLRERYTSTVAGQATAWPRRTEMVCASSEWLDPEMERRQQAARDAFAAASTADHAGTVGDVAGAIEVAKEIWEFLKDNKATWSGSHHVGTSVLNSADPNYLNYTHAKQGKTPTICYKYKNPFGITMGHVEMQLGGSYAARSQNAAVTPGFYIPDIHFEFSKIDVKWGVDASGEAVVTNLANNGGSTTQDPANPYCLVVATVCFATILRQRHRTFYFSAAGVEGFKLA